MRKFVLFLSIELSDLNLNLLEVQVGMKSLNEKICSSFSLFLFSFPSLKFFEVAPPWTLQPLNGSGPVVEQLFSEITAAQSRTPPLKVAQKVTNPNASP